jgi:hypothetical protein
MEEVVCDGVATLHKYMVLPAEQRTILAPEFVHSKCGWNEWHHISCVLLLRWYSTVRSLRNGDFWCEWRKRRRPYLV